MDPTLDVYEDPAEKFDSPRSLHSSDSESDEEFEDAVDHDKSKENDDDTSELSEKIQKLFTEEELQCNKDKSETLKNDGNVHFKAAEYKEAIDKYTEALDICPEVYANDRSILYSNRAAAHKYLESRDEAIQDCTKAIELNPNYLKAYIRRAALYDESNKLDECLEDNNKVIELDPSNSDARQNIIRLKPLIDERNEKLKTEMLGKLKDLGNLVLRPFGLSTNNFQLQQDPSTGSYSVNFNQTPNK